MGIKERAMARSEDVTPAAAAVQVALANKNAGQLIASMLPQIQRALPTQSGKEADRFARLLLTTMRRTPALLDCTQASLLGALMEVARLGLDPSSDLVYLLPFRDKKAGISNVEVLVSARGYIELALRSGRVLKVESRAVFSGDEFAVDYGAMGSQVRHIPAFSRGELTHVWARALGTAGQVWFECMSRAQVERIAHGRRGPWQSDFDEMARKTVIKRLAKQLPQTPAMDTAGRVDDSVVVDYDDEGEVARTEHFERLPEPAPEPAPELPPEVAAG